jgi:ABC-type phosphate transport system substrate-binding protein
MRLRLFAFLLAALVGPFGTAAAQDFKVIANPSVTAADAPADAIAKVFTKQSKKLPDGSTVTPADLGKDSPVRAAFTRAVHGKSVSAIETFWQQQIFSGKEVPPATKNSDAEMLAWVRSTPGAIGYVSGGASIDGVKVIAVK